MVSESDTDFEFPLGTKRILLAAANHAGDLPRTATLGRTLRVVGLSTRDRELDGVHMKTVSLLYPKNLMVSRRIRVTAGAFLLGVVSLLGSVSSAFGAETLHLVEHETTNTTIHVSKGRADSVGDAIVFANPVFDSTNTKQVGLLQGNCVRVIVGKSWECFFTLVLVNDRITLEGPYADSGESTFAITGGTGRYVGAKGQMTARSREAQSGAAASTDLIYDIR